MRRHVLAGGYRLVEGRDLVPDASPAQLVQLVTAGPMVPEAVAAARLLAGEGIAANVILATGPERLFSTLRDARHRRRRDAAAPVETAHLDVLLPPHERRAPIVTVQDASAHSLAFLGSVYGVPTVPLGVDTFGQSGAQADLYRYTGIGTDDIVAAAYLAVELRDEQA